MFTHADLDQLRRREITVEEAERQIALLASPDHHVKLARPCTVGDGVVRLTTDEIADLHALHAEAARAGRLVKFVPGSGAASRMFKSLLHFRQGAGRGTGWETAVEQGRAGDAQARELVTFVTEIRRFAFYHDLRDCLRDRDRDLDALAAAGKYEPILDGLLGAQGLDYSQRPKGLLKFHRYTGRGRTPLEEHLVEATRYARDGNGVCRLHFTVAPRNQPMFEATARDAQERGVTGDARFEIDFSAQKPATDTLSLDGRGQPLRDSSGRLKFRPGGHGALIRNLDDLRADLVFIKNIDNVRPDDADSVTSYWKRALAGYLVRLQRELFAHLDLLKGSAPNAEQVARARDFARERLGVERLGVELEQGGGAPSRELVERLVSRLDRPLRVCGVVPNTGEPGGGPFWVRDVNGGVSRQIVETSQVARDDDQQAILRGSTHFNPVDLVCAVSDHRGQPFDLTRFVDRQAVIVAAKSHGGRKIRALERPGLWNGAMARWNTVFVEVPIETFTPVKTVIDLLRDEHQTG